MGNIHAFREGDIPAVAALYLKVFPENRRFSLDALHAYFHKIFFENPWYQKDLASLVYEQSGAVVGFLGVIPRPMQFLGRPVRVAVSNHYMVDPEARTLAAMELLRTFFGGPQDLSIAEANDLSKKIWVTLQGSVSLLYTLHWTRMLRPAHYALYQLSKRGLPQALALLAVPFSQMADTVFTRSKSSPFLQVPQAPEREISDKVLLEGLSQISDGSTLKPKYDEQSLAWLLSIMGNKKRLGTLRKTAVYDESDQMIGWYLYLLSPENVSQVIQVVARPNAFPKVLDHLFYHAWRQGAIAVTGRMEPKYLSEFTDKFCLCHRGPWMLVHSRHPELLECLYRGDAFFTRMEGEWWISIEGELSR